MSQSFRNYVYKFYNIFIFFLTIMLVTEQDDSRFPVEKPQIVGEIPRSELKYNEHQGRGEIHHVVDSRGDSLSHYGLL